MSASFISQFLHSASARLPGDMPPGLLPMASSAAIPHRRHFLMGGAVCGVAAGALTRRDAQAAEAPCAPPPSDLKPSDALERDRQAILGMAGTYKVRFDFRETVPFRADYQPIAAKVSGGEEVVRVIEDNGTILRLQHLLVADDKDGDGPVVIKHWRQDWAHQPATMLVYRGGGEWTLQPVPETDALGAWTQTVWQTDDSPRYGGLGRWRHDAGVSRWSSGETWRPLARRDATRHPPYDRYLGGNRHALTPTGWVHEQDNAKLGWRDGTLTTFVHEVVVNTYTRSGDFAVAAADDYWNRTSLYWTAVRQTWDQMISRNRGVAVTEEPDNGSVTGHALMALADGIGREGRTATEAIAQARHIITTASRAPVKSTA